MYTPYTERQIWLPWQSRFSCRVSTISVFCWRTTQPLHNQYCCLVTTMGKKPLPADRRCGLSSICRRRTEPRIWTTCTKFGKDRACGSGDIIADRQTDRQTDRHTDILITVAVLRNRSRGQSKYHLDRMLSSNIVTHTHTHTHTHARTHCIKRPLKQSANISPQSCSEDAEESRTFEEGQCCDNGRHDIVYFLCPRQKKLHGLDKRTYFNEGTVAVSRAHIR